MKDCQGGQHPDDEPITWREFDREMAHRDKLAEEKARAVKEALEIKTAEVVAIAEKRAASTRMLVAVAAIAIPLLALVLPYIIHSK